MSNAFGKGSHPTRIDFPRLHSLTIRPRAVLYEWIRDRFFQIRRAKWDKFNSRGNFLVSVWFSNVWSFFRRRGCNVNFLRVFPSNRWFLVTVNLNLVRRLNSICWDFFFHVDAQLFQSFCDIKIDLIEVFTLSWVEIFDFDSIFFVFIRKIIMIYKKEYIKVFFLLNK